MEVLTQSLNPLSLALHRYLRPAPTWKKKTYLNGKTILVCESEDSLAVMDLVVSREIQVGFDISAYGWIGYG